MVEDPLPALAPVNSFSACSLASSPCLILPAFYTEVSMSYAAAIDQLSAMTPELFTQPGQTRRKYSLNEIGILLAALGNPHRRFRSILIAGTNGKGSTAATLASILTASGLRTGLYTSPHLTRPNERIRVNGVEIEDDAFAALYFRVHDCAQQLVLDQELAERGTPGDTRGPQRVNVASWGEDRSSSLGCKLAQLPSFFESLTAMAFLHFADAGIDIAVLEVGIGGRLDATNIVDPLLSIVTDISLDHTEWLGPTIAAITREKAGILRPGGTMITLPQHPDANQVLGEVATELGVRGVSAVSYMPLAHTAFGAARTVAEAGQQSSYYVEALGASIEVASPLHGAHQHRNIALAIAAAVELATRNHFPITPVSIEQGIRSTQWPGRLEVIQLQSLKGRVPHPSSAWVGNREPNPAPILGAPGLGSPATGPGHWGGALVFETWESTNPESAAMRLPPPQGSQWILDVAHNPAGAWALRAALRSLLHLTEPGAPPATLIFSCLRDKPIVEMAQILFPIFERVIFAPIHSPRATPMADLLAAAASTGTPATAAASVAEAIELAESAVIAPNNAAHPARIAAGNEAQSAPRVVVISGSVYLVGEARALLLARTGVPA